MEFEKCQMRVQVSQDSPCWTKNHLMDIHGRGCETDKKTNDLQTRTLCGLRFGKTCLMRRNTKANSVLSRNRDSAVPEDCVVLTPLILKVENSKIIWRMRIESWKFRCQPQCFANFYVRSTGKPVALTSARRNALALLRPMNPRGSAWKDLPHKNHEDHIEGKGMNLLRHYYLVRKIFP